MKNKSLQEAARAIIEGTPIVSEAVANANTLKPGSKHKDPIKSIKDNPSNVKTDDVEFIGDGPKNPGEPNPDATKKLKKDTSKAAGKDDGEKFGAGKGNLPGEQEVVDTDHTPETNDGEKFGVGKGNLPKVNEEDEVEEDFDLLPEEIEMIDALVEQGLSEEEIVEYMSKIYEEVDAEGDEGEGEETSIEEEVKSIDLTVDVDLTEDVDALFSGESLSEEFKEKAKTIFESAVKRKLSFYQTKLDEAFDAVVDSKVEEVKTNLEESVNDYMEYAVNQWIQENEVAIESALRVEITESFISSLKKVFVEHYIDIPEDKVDLIEELSSKVTSLETRLNEEIQTNVELNKTLNESMKREIVRESTEGLTDVEAEKIVSLAESIEDADLTVFSKKLNTLKESYIGGSKKTASMINEAVESDEETDTVSAPMARYLATLGRTKSR